MAPRQGPLGGHRPSRPGSAGQQGLTDRCLSPHPAARIIRTKQWCDMRPCLEGEGCDLLINRSGWTCTQPGGRIKTTTVRTGPGGGRSGPCGTPGGEGGPSHQQCQTAGSWSPQPLILPNPHTSLRGRISLSPASPASPVVLVPSDGHWVTAWGWTERPPRLARRKLGLCSPGKDH